MAGWTPKSREAKADEIPRTTAIRPTRWASSTPPPLLGDRAPASETRSASDHPSPERTQPRSADAGSGGAVWLASASSRKETQTIPTPGMAERAYVRMAPRFIDQQARKGPRLSATIDLRDASLTALGVDDRLRSGDRLAAVTALSRAGFVQTALVEGLRDVALAAFHVASKLADASDSAPGVGLSAELRTEAAECRKRMRATLETTLKDPAARELLRHLRSGNGDLALSNDLLGYAKLYSERRLDLERGAHLYRANDEARARRLAVLVRRHTRPETEQQDEAWMSVRPGAVSLLLEHYAESARVGRFLERDEIGLHYPPLTVRFTGGADEQVEPKPLSRVRS